MLPVTVYKDRFTGKYVNKAREKNLEVKVNHYSKSFVGAFSGPACYIITPGPPHRPITCDKVINWHAGTKLVIYNRG